MTLVQDSICQALEKASGDKFKTDEWNYKQGKGGGLTKVITGDVIEKGGVNFSAVEGRINEKLAKKMKVSSNTEFFATGVSLVLHPKNPFVPTVHMNIRYIDTGEKWWVGGGIDMTPYYPNIDDIKHFHLTLKKVCDQHRADYYEKFKKWCDEYFFIKHRNEARGVGGIFFDYINDDWQKNFNFVLDLGNSFNDSYIPILNARKDIAYSEENRKFQYYRRGRYVEFNLIYDRGTLFGLETQGRIESILMSLPPLASWVYDYKPTAGTAEAEIYKYLTPQNWV
ncbi:MAG: oxygen-dependent coproporphyrinogen oxidase [SAR324 cluster bacterium]|nr:oxygen-dependent coproporphyrinogen oxidase [SAR324 cluster bacterium]